MLDYLKERAEKAGLTFLESPMLGKLLEQQAKLEEDCEDPEVLELDVGDAVIAHGHDADAFLNAIDLVGMCLKHPGQKTFVIAEYESFGNLFTAFFAVDSVREATKRARIALEKSKKKLEGGKNEDAARS